MFQGTIVADRPIAAPLGFGQRPKPRAPLRLVVDLGHAPLSRVWWRGAATLVGLTAMVAMLSPGMEPLAGGRASEKLDGETAEQSAALGIGTLAGGSRTGLRMTETAAAEPLAEVPARSRLNRFATIAPGEGIGRLLVRSGVAARDAIAAETLVRSAGTRVAVGTGVSITLGQALGGGQRPLERMALRPRLDLSLVVRRQGDALVLDRIAIPVDTRPLRIRGRAGPGLYWSLRAAGASPATAAGYLQAIGGVVEVGSEILPDDRFELVVANRRAASGESVGGALLYAGLDRSMARDLQLLRWPGERGGWVDAAEATPELRSTGGAMRWPVAARITSGFGMRVHPILRFARMHRGIDFGAHWGTPIVAAGDGQVIRVGWAGGYGRQVRIAHSGGLVTSYSHMSRMTAAPGHVVRQGELIGYVGSSGLSTGPHLHFETIRNGQAVDPMGVSFASRASIDPGQVSAIRARLRLLLGR